MTQQATQPSHLKMSVFMIALLLSGVTALQAGAGTITIDQDRPETKIKSGSETKIKSGSETKVKIDFSKRYEKATLFSARRISDNKPVTVSADFDARILIYWGEDRECAWAIAKGAPLELDWKSLRCHKMGKKAAKSEEEKAAKSKKIGYVSVEKDGATFRIAVDQRQAQTPVAPDRRQPRYHGIRHQALQSAIAGATVWLLSAL